MIHTSLFTLPKQLVRVWRNEFTRCICDRLSSEQVRCFFKRINDDNSNATHTHTHWKVSSAKKKHETRFSVDFSLFCFFFLFFLFALFLALFSFSFSDFVSIVVGDFSRVVDLISWQMCEKVWDSEKGRVRAKKQTECQPCAMICRWIHCVLWLVISYECDGWHCHCESLLLNSIRDYSLTK